MQQHNNVHRQQLFNWIGRHIEAETPGHHLNDNLRIKYLDCFREALNRGLWVKTPDKPDYLWDESTFKVDQPIVCFTEWALSQSRPHTAEYGRLALGFPKRFVLSRGGQPVMYIRDGQKGAPYAAALRKVAEWFGKQPANHEIRPIQEQFRYLMHFTKRIGRTKKKFQDKQKRSMPEKKPAFRPDPFKKQFGPILHYLEEREWRIVYSETTRRCFLPGNSLGKPKYYLPFQSGRDLFTVVFPDHKTHRMAIEDKSIRQALYPENAPQVTVLSLEDVGTF